MAVIPGDDKPNALSDNGVIGGGDDSLYGFGGNDQLRVSTGRDYVNGGLDDDTIEIFWGDATGWIYVGAGYAFVNTGVDEDSYATSKRKVGFDAIEHLYVVAGSGDDTLNGIAGSSDTLLGGGGADVWSDDFYNFTGDLKINMSDGGGALADGSAIGGMEAAQFLSLGSGNDSFRDYGRFGGAFDDSVYGRGGNDRMETSCGKDYFGGGDGTDTLVVNWVNRREGSYLTAPGGYGFAFTSADAYYGNSLRKIGFDGFEILNFTGGLADDTVVGFANTADRINGSNGADRWEDDFSAFTGDLKVDLALQGPDRPLADGSVYYNLESVSLVLGSGNDSFRDLAFLSDSADYNDVIRSNAGNDDIGTSGGRDEFYAGDGTDTVRIHWQAAARPIFVDALASIGFVNFSGNDDYASSKRRVFFENFERLDVIGSTEDDSFRGFSNSADSFDGGNGDDLWIDDFSAFKKDLDIDVHDFADGFGRVKLADGTRLFQIDRAQLVLGSGNDRFSDTRYQDDRVEGRGGNDRFATMGGKDSMHGGDGSDKLSIDWSNAFAKCTVNGLTGQAWVATKGGDTFESSARRVEFSSIESLNVKGGARSDFFVGTAGRDVFDGSNGSDVIDYSAKTESVEVTLKFASLVDVKVGGKVEDRIQDIEYVIGGSGDDRLTGDLSNNALTGGGGDDRLDGGEFGNDLLTGGAGDDLFFIRNAGDLAAEKEGEGIDTVRSSVTYSLQGQDVEKLILTGSAAIDGTGNKLDNTITGNDKNNELYGRDGHDTISAGDGKDKISAGDGNDTLTGGDGNDSLTSGKGFDTFRFASALDKKNNVDRITDFDTDFDRIALDNRIFKALGKAGDFDPDMFKDLGVKGAEKDKSDRILYDSDTGELFYDANGSGKGKPVLFAELDKVDDRFPVLGTAHFFVV